MKLKLASTQPVTIGALTAIAEGVTPASSDTPFSVIWTLIKRLTR
jgi:hypothetical protein